MMSPRAPSQSAISAVGPPPEPAIEDRSGGASITHLVAQAERQNRSARRLLLAILLPALAFTLAVMAWTLRDVLSPAIMAALGAFVLAVGAWLYVAVVRASRVRGFEVWIDGGSLCWRAEGQRTASAPVASVKNVYVVDSLDFEETGSVQPHEVTRRWLCIMTAGGADHTIAEVSWISPAGREWLVAAINHGLDQARGAATPSASARLSSDS